jgi:hypothetical protein
MISDDANPWSDGYEMGCRHGYETATRELLSIARERRQGGADITELLAVHDELRGREYRALGQVGGGRSHSVHRVKP